MAEYHIKKHMKWIDGPGNSRLCARPMGRVLKDTRCTERARLITSEDNEGLSLWMIPNGAWFCEDCGYMWPVRPPYSGAMEGAQCPRPFDTTRWKQPEAAATPRRGVRGGVSDSRENHRPPPPDTCAVYEPEIIENVHPSKWVHNWRFGRLRESWYLVEDDKFDQILEQTSLVFSWIKAGCQENPRAARLYHKWFTPAGAEERFPSRLPQRQLEEMG